MKQTYYKYRSLYQNEATGRSPNFNTRAIFDKAELYYAVPKSFNDPYDCNLRLHARDSTDAEWEAFLDDLIHDHGDPTGNLTQFKKQKLWKTNPGFADEFGKSTLRTHYEESSVLCLAKKGNSIPMFAYYGDNHCGIAVEFSFDDTDIPCGISFSDTNARGVPWGGKIVFRDVEYPTAFPELNYMRLRGSDQLVRSLIFTKHHEWSHEEEFRIFRRNVPASAVGIDRRILTRVIFGCRATQAEIDLVKGWLIGWPSDVILSRTEQASDQFELRIVDFEVVKGV